ncbi:hypothetical protein CPB84DRAFT_1814020 [Gymnopilus junonius]|uniref:Uncharacterized protein n=1 Tax=Gymnopilus junonius TaxID=109634 RepID=A0A9P5NWD8_GYMJU|nr:hypothetical protein CPB84DRAFT_1814020 [Gymnopilus junonius]
MSSTFTPSTSVDLSKERDWPANLGMLDWDDTSIVFTKRSLIEFLKYTGTTVDTNLNNIAKLPRYAKFGETHTTFTTAQHFSGDLETGAQTYEKDAFVPSRRVRTVPGGPHIDIFAHDNEDDALSQAPPQAKAVKIVASPDVDVPEPEGTGIRRVRENPGGNSSLSNFWDAEEPAEFNLRAGKYERVREGPGGHDSISSVRSEVLC